MNRALFAVLFALPLAACGGRVDLFEEPAADGGVTESGTSDAGPVVTCEPSECGPAPRSPAEVCWDGSLGGNTGRCLRQPSGACGWEYRECPPATGACTKSSECGTGAYCEVTVGACGAAGFCSKLPSGCDFSYAPVCGCDGKTYSNACAAKKAGATIAATGACAPTPGCGAGAAGCPSGQWCKSPDGVCGPSAGASCKLLPDACPDVYFPVCGCDGKEYPNPCEAESARMNVAYKGKCSEPPYAMVCGGSSGTVCPSAMYCDAPAGAMCGSTGVCRTRPSTCSNEYKPVCGCDRKTYSNACQAARAGVDAFKDGAC